MEHEPHQPDFFDKGTTRSFKETFCAAVLLWVLARTQKPRRAGRATARTAVLLGIAYLVVRHGHPPLLQQFLP
jgi:hypothetical protein